MRTDSVVISDGIKILLERLGQIDTERFITLIRQEPFDYTKWQETLLEEFSVGELCDRAMEHWNKED